MKKTILLYGLVGGVLITVLKLTEYRFLVIEHSLEIYGGLVALLFSAIGIWLGLKLTKTKETIVVREVAVPALRHRVLLSLEGEREGVSPDSLIEDALAAVAPEAS